MAKFLIIRFSSIGDIVLTTPVVRCIKNDSSNHTVHYLTKKKFLTLLELNPYIDKLYAIEKNIYEILSQLKLEKYDYIIDLHNNLRTASLKFHLNVKSFTYKKLNFRKWMFVKLKLNALPTIHVVERYLNTLSTLKIYNDGKGLDFFIDSSVKIDLPKTHTNYIAFVIGGAHATKRLPVEKIINICNKIKEPILLVGGNEDKITSQLIVQYCGENVLDSCGEFSLQQSALAIKGADLVITHDTGMMHIAAAFNKKIISIWGNTVPEFGMYPYLSDSTQNVIVQVSDLDCRPCSKIGFVKCPKQHFDCMNKIDENLIIKSI